MSLEGMTQEKWCKFTPAEREKLQDLSGLTKQLVGLEGWRVEVVIATTSEKRRFIVGRSAGWRPCHIELRNLSSRGGVSANYEYASVRKLAKIR